MKPLPGPQALGDRPTPHPAGGIATIDIDREAAAATRSALAVGDVGKAMNNLAVHLEHEEERQDQLKAESAINQAKQRAMDLESGEEGFDRLKGERAVAKPVVNQYRARLDGELGQVEAGLVNDRQRELFRQRIEPLKGLFHNRLIKHVADEGSRFAEDVTKNTLAIERDAAVQNWDQPGAYGASMARIAYTLEAQAERAGWSAERLQESRKQIESSIHFGVVDRLLANRQDREAGAYYEALKGTLDPDVATKIERALTVTKERHERESEAEAARQAAVIGSDLEIAVRRGQAGYAAIEEGFKGGVITPAKRVELTTHLDNEQRKAAERAAALREQIGKVSAALDGRGFLDFRSGDDRKAVDTFYSSVVAPGLTRPGTPPTAAAQTVVDFSARTGIVPGPVRQALRGALRAGKPEDRVGAADMLDRLKSANPQVLNDFSEEDIRLGNTIATYVRAGVAPAKAVGLAEASINVPESERAVRKERFKEDKLEQKGEKWLQSETTGFRFLGPSLPGKLPDAMVGEFERLTQEEFVRTGEIEAARKTALDHMRSVWGVTRTGKEPRWMKYAPEAVYGVPGDDGKWIKEQLQAEVKGFFPATPNLTLAADSLTAREERPSYVVLNEVNGVLEPVWGKDGKPMRFRPNFPASPAGAKQRQALEADKAEALRLLGSPDARRVVTGTVRPAR